MLTTTSGSTHVSTQVTLGKGVGRVLALCSTVCFIYTFNFNTKIFRYAAPPPPKKKLNIGAVKKFIWNFSNHKTQGLNINIIIQTIRQRYKIAFS